MESYLFKKIQRGNMKNKRKVNEQQSEEKLKDSSIAHSKTAISKPEYVNFILTLERDMKSFDPEAFANLVKPYTHEDRNKYPIVVTEAHIPVEAMKIGTIGTAVIKDSKYTFPKDFDYDYSFRSELNEETGYGFELIKEKLRFMNLPGCPTLIGLSEQKTSGATEKMECFENFGNYQLAGTGIFKRVQGSGIGMCGVSTGLIVYHVALISGWPF
jgi:hypothetical protein